MLLAKRLKKTLKKVVKKTVKKELGKAHEKDGGKDRVKDLKKVALVAAIPVAAIAVAGGAVAVTVHLRRKRRKEASSFLSADVRNALQGLCSLKGEDFIPDHLGSSIYQRRLDSLTDKQLIGVYAVIKLVEVLRASGIDFRSLSKDRLVSGVLSLRNPSFDRHDAVAQLGSFGAATAKSLLGDAVLLAGMAAQAA